MMNVNVKKETVNKEEIEMEMEFVESKGFYSVYDFTDFDSRLCYLTTPQHCYDTNYHLFDTEEEKEYLIDTTDLWEHIEDYELEDNITQFSVEEWKGLAWKIK